MTNEELAAIVKPGNHPEGVRYESMKPCGGCDGVVWLAGGVKAIENPDGTIQIEQIDEKACEKEALRYLRPMPALWMALHPGKDGISTPLGVEVMFTAEMYRLEKETGRPIQFAFASTEQGIFAAHPRFRQPAMCWKIVKLAEFIWGFVFDPPKTAPVPAVVEPIAPEIAARMDAQAAAHEEQRQVELSNP